MKETPKRLAPTTDTLRALFAKSGNKCAFPDCDHPLIDEDNNFIAQVCHIEDALPGGRFNEDMTNEQRRSYSNLVLFCYRHHIQTNNVEKFSVPRLQEIKTSHELLFTETFVVQKTVLINIFNDLKSIKDDTSEIKKTQQTHSEQLDEIKALLSIKKQDTKTESQKSGYIEEIETILKLRDTNNHKVALQILEDFKKDKWEKLNGTERYKLIANMGIFHLELNSQNEAADCFIEAIGYDPENEKAFGFAALGHSIKGNTEEAQKNIAQAIVKNPKNPNAYIALIALERDNLEFTELLSQVPQELHDTQEISYAIGGLARHKNDLTTAINWYQNAVDVATKNKAELKANLASTILETVTDPFQIITGQVDNDSRNKINYCIELLSEAWEDLKDSDLRKSRTWLLVNRGIAKKYIKDFDGAFEDIKQAVSISENGYLELKHLAIVAFETNQLDYSLKLLDQLELSKANEDYEDIDIDLFKANVLYKKRDFKLTIKTLSNVTKNNTNQKVKDEANSLLISAYLADGNSEESKKLSLSIVESRPDYIRGYMDAVRVLHNLGEDEDALTLLNTAYDKLDDDTSNVDAQDVAFEFAQREDYIKSISILEKITNPQLYTELSKTLLKAYYKAGETGKALNLCESIRANHGPIDMIVDMQSTIYESIDDLENAIRVCEEYLIIYPDDQFIQIKLALNYFRIKNEDKVRKILHELSALGDLPFNILFQLAYLNFSIGESEKGLDIAFETRRRYKDIGNVHMKYIGLFTEFRKLDHLTELEKVEINTVVKIKNEQGSIQTYYITDKTEQLLKEELSITDLLAKSLIDKSIGDIVEIDKKIGSPQKFEVIAILNKYIYAFQESIELLDTKFVEEEGFRVFNGKKTGNIKEDFKPLFDSIDQNQKYDNQIFEHYTQKSFPIGACAQLRRENPIKFWSLVFGNIEFGIFSVGSNHSEINNSLILLEKGDGIVIDLISLLCLASIKRLELLEQISNKKFVARSTIETIDELIREFKGISSEGYLSIGKIGGEYTRHHVSKEQIEDNKIHYENLLRWIDAHCEILPCNEALSMNASKKEQYDKTLGKNFIDSILIAKEHDYLLLAEEESIRSIALDEFQVKSFPNYTLFLYCLKENIINNDTFNEDVISLINLNYKFIPINSDILFKSAEIVDFQVIHPFTLAMKTLDFTVSSEDSSIAVAVEFFNKLYTSDCSTEARKNLIISVLRVLVNGRDFNLVIQKIVVLIEMKYALLPEGLKDELIESINEFLENYKG